MLAMIIAFIVFLKVNIERKKELKSGHDVTQAKISNIKQVSLGRSGKALQISFLFELDGICYESSKKYLINKNRFKLHPNDYQHFINKSFPLIHSRRNDGPFTILITKSDFRYYNLIYPDSLQWTEPYLYGKNR